jgi:FkbM family methyltransferase
MRTLPLAKRLSDKLRREIYKFIHIDIVSGAKIYPNHGVLEKIGSEYGGWIVPINTIKSDSICYCVGVGEDITFDLGLIDKFGCTVFAYDPTPRAAEHVKKFARSYANNFKYFEVGLWDRDEIVRFYAPSNSEHVSHSALNLQNTDRYFEAQCKRLSTLMMENRHSKIDLLKLDIEGAEYKAVESIIKDELDIRIICIEYDEAYNPLDNNYKNRIQKSVLNLIRYGYNIVAVDAKCNYTFVRYDTYIC